MLDFLRDRCSEEQRTAGAVDAEQGYLAIRDQNQIVRKGTKVLAALFAAGLLSLLIMIVKSAPQAASGGIYDSNDIGYQASSQLSGVSSEVGGLGRIVNKFYKLSNTPQVNVGKLKKNPFKREVLLSDLDEYSENNGFDITAVLSKQERLSRKAAAFELLGIMRFNNRTSCMIDDKILYEGDSIRGFKVIYIGDNLAKLKSNDVEITLSLIND